jgi:hypothetical protein
LGGAGIVIVPLFVLLDVISTNSTKRPTVLFLRPLKRSQNSERKTPHRKLGRGIRRGGTAWWTGEDLNH